MSGLKKCRTHASGIQTANSISDKILAMRTKIEDSTYINNAVQVIAIVLSKRIVEQPKAY